jgi:hypothetical protein
MGPAYYSVDPSVSTYKGKGVQEEDVRTKGLGLRT